MLWQLRDRFRTGVLFAIYLLYAGTERFLVEFLRRNDAVALGLTSAQLESLGMMIAGMVWIYVVEAPPRRPSGVPYGGAMMREPTWTRAEKTESEASVGADDRRGGRAGRARRSRPPAARSRAADAEALVADALGIDVEQLSSDGAAS